MTNYNQRRAAITSKKNDFVTRGRPEDLPDP